MSPAAITPDPGAAPGEGHPPQSVSEALARTHEWFHRNSGWAPPDDETVAEWLADGVCRCPDDCIVGPAEWCAHGLASWSLVLEAQAAADQLARERRAVPGQPRLRS